MRRLITLAAVALLLASCDAGVEAGAGPDGPGVSAGTRDATSASGPQDSE